MHRLNIFNSVGLIRTDLDEKEIAKCSDAQRAALFPLLDAWANTKAEDAACAETEAAKRRAETALDKSRKAYEKALPVWTAHDEWKKTVARLPVPEPDPAVIKRVAAALKVVQKAEQHLAECVAAEYPAKALRKEKRMAFSTALRHWSTLDGVPKSTGDLVGERSRVEIARKRENIANGMPADYAAHVASTVGPSHLDRFKAGQGKGGSANVGYNPNRMRGAQLQMMKPPSER